MNYPPVDNPLGKLGDEYNLRDTLEKAQDELIELIRERERIEWRITKLQSDIVHLSALCGVEIEDPMTQLGLTDAVRWIIASNTHTLSGALSGRPMCPMATAEIVETLKKEYPNASNYKNLNANVQTILKRLVKSGVVRIDTYGTDETMRYRWIGSTMPPIPPPPGWVEERMNKKFGGPPLASIGDALNKLVLDQKVEEKK